MRTISYDLDNSSSMLRAVLHKLNKMQEAQSEMQEGQEHILLRMDSSAQPTNLGAVQPRARPSSRETIKCSSVEIVNEDGISLGDMRG